MNPTRRIKVAELAKRLKVHRKTLEARLRDHNIEYKFSTISNADLDQLVKNYLLEKPSSIRYLTAYLRRKGLKLQKCQITASLARVDKLGRTLRRRGKDKVIVCGTYKVARPHELWHIDGHHKLIVWGFVIHGCADGYTRTVGLPFYLFMLFLSSKLIDLR